MRIQLLLAGLAGWLAFAAPAPAAVVTYHMDLSVPGEFSLFASASLDDNFGICFYDVTFSEATAARITSLDHLSPLSHYAVNSEGLGGPAGFNVIRSTELFPGHGLSIAAAQQTICPTPHLIRGLGQTAGSFSELGLTPLCPPVQPEWGESLLLARGTYLGDANDFRLDPSSVDLLAMVFSEPSGTNVMQAEVRLTDSNGFQWMKPPVPDPIPSIPPPTEPPVNLPPPPDPIVVVDPTPPVIEPPIDLPEAPSDPSLEIEPPPITVDPFPSWPFHYVGDPIFSPIVRPIEVLTPEQAGKFLIETWLVESEVPPPPDDSPEYPAYVIGGMAIDYVYTTEFKFAGLSNSIDALSRRANIVSFLVPQFASSETAVPEPAAVFLAALAMFGLAAFAPRRPARAVRR